MKPLHRLIEGPVRRRTLLQRALAAAALTTVTGFACAAPADTSTMRVADNQKDPTVDIKNFAFVPATLTVPAGTRVVWINRDDEAHLVASTNGAFKPSPAMDTDDTFAMVFDKPGTYAYFCAIHPMMRGTVVVK